MGEVPFQKILRNFFLLGPGKETFLGQPEEPLLPLSPVLSAFFSRACHKQEDVIYYKCV
jgi:hypothetical protein